MARGLVYLTAVVDWFSRRVPAWRLSITMEGTFWMEAVNEALARHGRPEIFNTDQGCQFTSGDFTDLLLENGVTISMDGKGAWRDNVFVERIWRSVKYEEVYLKAYDTVSDVRASIGRYFAFYNSRRPHRALTARRPTMPTSPGDRRSRQPEASGGRSTYRTRNAVHINRATSHLVDADKHPGALKAEAAEQLFAVLRTYLK
jgi:transposase InsO family protein